MVDTDKKEETDLGDKPTPIPEAHVVEETIARVASKPPSSPPFPAPESPAASQIPVPSLKPAEELHTDIAKILEEVKLPERRNGEKVPESVQASLPQAEVPAAEVPQEKISTMAPRSALEKQRDIVSSVHTLKNDLQNAVRDQKISVVRAASLEEDRRAHETSGPEETPERTRRSKPTFAIIFSIVLLCIVGAGALFAVYAIMRERTGTPILEMAPSILFAEQSFVLPISNYSAGDLKRALAEARISSTGTLGSIVRILPVVEITNPDNIVQEVPASFSEFMRAIGAHPPDPLLRALGDDFFFGIHAVDKNAPLIIVPVVSYDHAFAEMLSWEDALNADLVPVFTSVPSFTTNQNGIPSKRTFQDLIMRNYDVRALKDDAGEIQLYYSFPNQRMLVIAESPYSFTEILSRLQAGQKL